MNRERFWKQGVLVREICDGQEISKNLGKRLDELRRPVLPSKLAMARSAVGAGAQIVRHGLKKVSDEEKGRRLSVCEACEFLVRGKSDRCSKCGCFVKWKTALESWHCPIGKW